MIDPTLSSTNPSQPQETSEVSEAKDLNEKSQPPKNMGMSLLDIPIFPKSTSEPVSTEKTLHSQLSEPSLCDDYQTKPTSEWNHQDEIVEGKHEYEFSLCYDGCLCFVCLWDTNDVSACERVIHRPVKPEEITYSPTGNGFIVDEEFKYTFTKAPYKRTWKNEVVYENTIGRPQRKHQSAEDILSSF